MPCRQLRPSSRREHVKASKSYGMEKKKKEEEKQTTHKSLKRESQIEAKSSLIKGAADGGDFSVEVVLKYNYIRSSEHSIPYHILTFGICFSSNNHVHHSRKIIIPSPSRGWDLVLAWFHVHYYYPIPHKGMGSCSSLVSCTLLLFFFFFLS